MSEAANPTSRSKNGSLVQHNVPVPVFSGRLSETALWLVLPSYLYFVQFAADRLGWADRWQFLARSSVTISNDPGAVSCALLHRLKHELATPPVKLLLVLQYGAVQTALKPPNMITVASCAREMGVDTLDLGTI
jgi:hypothetical protein